MGLHRVCRFMIVCVGCMAYVAWGAGGDTTAIAAPDPATGSDATGSGSNADGGGGTAGTEGQAGGSDSKAGGSNSETGAANGSATAQAAARELARQVDARDASVKAAELTAVAKDVVAKDATTRADLVKMETALDRFTDLRVATESQKETAVGAAQVNTSVSGLSDSNVPQWSLLADAAITSLDFSQPTLSIGLERATPTTLAMVAFRKNAADNSVSGTDGDPAFGRAVLAPALASFSIATHIEWRPRASIQCAKDCRLPTGLREINTKKSKGLYFSAEAAYAKLVDTSVMRPNGSMVSGYFSPFSVSVGGIYRLEGEMPQDAKFGTKKLGLAGYIGLTGRVISGDLDSADRATIFGTPQRYYGGVEAGAMVQIGNVLVDPKIIALTDNHNRIPGLTGLQLQISLSFLLPWTVLSGS